MNKNIGDMTESELKDFIIELQEENSRYERKIEKLEDNWNKLKEHFEFLKINSTGGNKEFIEDIIGLMKKLERRDNK